MAHRTPGEFGTTPAEVFATRQALWELRRERERREEEQLRDSGQGVTAPLEKVPELDRYMFDLQGFLVIKAAVGPEQLRAMNEATDRADAAHVAKPPALSAEEAEAMNMADPHSLVGKERQQGVACDAFEGIGLDPCFDCLIAHPGYIAHVRDFTNGDDTVLINGGGSVVIRWPGQASGAHGTSDIWRAGGEQRLPEPNDGVYTGNGGARTFYCQVVSILLALNDCPPGGGNTAVVVGSHKSNFRHPYMDPEAGHPQLLWRCEEEQPVQGSAASTLAEGGFMDGMPGAVEVPCEAGDALVLCEAATHGSLVRTLPGSRRFVLLRYGPDPKGAWRPPPEIRARLGPEARALVSSESELPEEPIGDEQVPAAKL
jgi:hypothetical protein